MSAPKISAAKKLLLGVVTVFVASAGLCGWVLGPCWSLWWRDGVVVYTCPAGAIASLSVEADRLGRGVQGTVRVRASAQLYGDQFQLIDVQPLRRFQPTLTIVDAAGVEAPVDVLQSWWGSGWDWADLGLQEASVILPDTLPDGDYILRARAEGPRGQMTVDAPLPLFRPALEHVLTDAPLYRPGQVVKARAVLLEAGSLAPALQRPGRWQVHDPNGDLAYEEKDNTGATGVADFTFPLAEDAPVGNWMVGLLSGEVTARRSFEVREFRLPRFTVEMTPERAWFGPAMRVAVDGVARYTSGAPVQDGPVRLTLRTDGDWPPPNDWPTEFALTTDREGRFHLDLGEVPDDLVGRVTVAVSAAVTEAAGETAGASASLLLSEDPIAVEAVTELGGGLVADANNRMYLRVTTPAGATVAGARVTLRREWDKRDPGVEAVADADGVARFQLDPGAAITVTEPTLPVRPPKPPEAVVIFGLSDAVTGGADLSLEGLADGLTPAWAPCARRGSTSAALTLRVSAAGVTDLWSEAVSPGLRRCLLGAAGRVGIRGSGPRLVELTVQLDAQGAASLEATVSAFAGDAGGVQVAVDDALADHPECSSGVVGGVLPQAWVWEVAAGASTVRMQPVDADGLDELAEAASCVGRALASVRVPVADVGAAGLVSITNQVGASSVSSRTSPASWPGFAFVVAVEGVGDTLLRMPIGQVPLLRLRFSEVVVAPKDEIELTAVRGKSFTGTVPNELRLMQGDRLLQKITFAPEARVGHFTVPEGVSGFASVEWEGARAVMYVRPAEELHLALSAETAWKPGEKGTLTVRSTGRSGPTSAVVTLAGVDVAMRALAPLPGAADWADTTVLARSEQPAFGLLDAKLLQTGQIVGDNALQATVLRITGLPPAQPGADSVSCRGDGTPDVETPLAAAFWPLYAEARIAVRAWEANAAEGEVLTAAAMTGLWDATLAKHPAADPFGRRLSLRILPHDLLVLTDPRIMVADARHLPEDEENWPLYVATELR